MTLAHLMENAEERGRKAGLQEGLQAGRKEGEARMNKLIQALISAGRLKDLEKASKDEAYQKALFEEFGL